MDGKSSHLSKLLKDGKDTFNEFYWGTQHSREWGSKNVSYWFAIKLVSLKLIMDGIPLDFEKHYKK